MTLQILTAHYTPSIEALELPAFRGAVIKTFGKEHQLFHNHQSESAYSYQYPQVQYKRIAHEPVLVCVNIPKENTQLLFTHPHISLVLKEKTLQLSLQQIKLVEHLLGFGKIQSYHINNWIALNEHNYKKYQELENELSKIELLESILKGNIISFAKGIGWEVDQTLQLRIDEIKKIKLVPYKGQRLTAFDLHFRTNAQLPEYIGLGKGVSLGFGVIKYQIA